MDKYWFMLHIIVMDSSFYCVRVDSISNYRISKDNIENNYNLNTRRSHRVSFVLIDVFVFVSQRWEQRMLTVIFTIDIQSSRAHRYAYTLSIIIYPICSNDRQYKHVVNKPIDRTFNSYRNRSKSMRNTSIYCNIVTYQGTVCLSIISVNIRVTTDSNMYWCENWVDMNVIDFYSDLFLYLLRLTCRIYSWER
jgi:hypothetical protein